MPKRIIVTEYDWHRLTYERYYLNTLSFLILPIIARQPYAYWVERDLHHDIGKALRSARVPVRHEVTLGPGAKIDFVSRGVGIEIKTAGSPTNVKKQLQRYHATGKLSCIVLLTTRADHIAEIPESGLGGITTIIPLWAYRDRTPQILRETEQFLRESKAKKWTP